MLIGAATAHAGETVSLAFVLAASPIALIGDLTLIAAVTDSAVYVVFLAVNATIQTLPGVPEMAIIHGRGV